MEIVVLKQAKRELAEAPQDVLIDVFALFDELARGKLLGMPVSRPLSSIAKGLHELRVVSRSGQFRVFYVVRIGRAIYVVHASSKKTQKMAAQTVDLLKARIRSLDL